MSINWNAPARKKEPYTPQRFEAFLAHYPELEPLYAAIFKALELFHDRLDNQGKPLGFWSLGSINFEVEAGVLKQISLSNIERDFNFPVKIEGLNKIKNINALLDLAFHCAPYETKKEKQELIMAQTYGVLYMKSQELPNLTLCYRGGYRQKYEYRFDYLNCHEILAKFDDTKIMTDIYDFFNRRPLELSVPLKAQTKGVEVENKTRKTSMKI